MQQNEVLKNPAAVLTEIQRQQFFDDGCSALPGLIDANWLARLKAAHAELVDRSRHLTKSDAMFLLEEGHSADDPRLHRITSPQDLHPVFWEFFTCSLLTDLVADVVGPDVKFHHAKLNTKAERGSTGFFWHQDVPGWPHTDYSPVTVGIYLEGCTVEQGPVGFIPGSHAGPLYDQYDDDGRVIPVPPSLLEQNESKLRFPTGGPGTVILLHCRVVHGSSINTSSAPRPLLLPVYSSADSFPYTPNPLPSAFSGEIVRGKRARFASFDSRPCRIPPPLLAAHKGLWDTGMKDVQAAVSP